MALSQTRQSPGVYSVEALPAAPKGLPTGVPAFLGLTETGTVEQPVRVALWSQFVEVFGAPRDDAYLGIAVRGFFANNGRFCFVVPLDEGLQPDQALANGLAAIRDLRDVDLVCVPDLFRLRPPGEVARPVTDPAEARVLQDRSRVLQQHVLEECDRDGQRLALLDSLENASPSAVLEQRGWLHGTNGALYYPWVRPYDWPTFVPPCGHVAGIVSRTDEQTGVHKAPANEVLEGVLDLEKSLTDAQQAEVNPAGVNCLRAFRGRGIRVYGARTLSDQPAWTYVPVRRLFLTAARWVERNLVDVTFEPNDPTLWVRIERELGQYFEQLFRQGALRGATPEQAFYVKCDAETNDAAARDAGTVTTEIGLAPAVPNEFVVVTIVHQPGGVSVLGPVRPT
jgi:hypothetical protein